MYMETEHRNNMRSIRFVVYYFNDNNRKIDILLSKNCDSKSTSVLQLFALQKEGV